MRCFFVDDLGDQCNCLRTNGIPTIRRSFGSRSGELVSMEHLDEALKVLGRCRKDAFLAPTYDCTVGLLRSRSDALSDDRLIVFERPPQISSAWDSYIRIVSDWWRSKVDQLQCPLQIHLQFDGGHEHGTYLPGYFHLCLGPGKAKYVHRDEYTFRSVRHGCACLWVGELAPHDRSSPALIPGMLNQFVPRALGTEPYQTVIGNVNVTDAMELVLLRLRNKPYVRNLRVAHDHLWVDTNSRIVIPHQGLARDIGCLSFRLPYSSRGKVYVRGVSGFDRVHPHAEEDQSLCMDSFYRGRIAERIEGGHFDRAADFTWACLQQVADDHINRLAQLKAFSCEVN